MGITRVLRIANSVFRRKLIQLCSKGQVSFSSNVLVDNGVVIRCTDGGKVHIGSGVFLGRNVMIVSRGAAIHIGDRTHVSHGTTVVAKSSISIGDDGLIGEYVTIRDQDHAISKGRISHQEFAIKPVVIESNVWLGAKVTVLRGSKIESGVVVGANSLVKGRLASGAVYAGIPAKRVKVLSPD
ncbi:acyltransferase [Marinihelvus fidelis]|uniref:Acyltransferase n=1 Tax=Marinihelvus fidelis TaxID=2613842 RepID=A0A5N0TDG0_9GAMM|nr:acyltransferase [Marinihelvus fidelis]KAA9133062.1 acyltransferase [Marinihelvus fidelis]